jgi:hypothetical protein
MSNPRSPVYIPSKGRWDTRLTVRALERIGVPYRIVVQPGEYANYAAVINPANIITLPYDMGAGEVNELGEGGLVFARNFILDHAKAEGHEWFWIIDDNVDEFFRLNNNIKCTVKSGSIFRIAEDFVHRFDNVGQAGLQYYMFIPRKQAYEHPPVALNRRIYSITYMNTYTERWRGVFNDDTDLSLRLLKKGMATILFNAFLGRKIATMTVKGGNTGIYQGAGRLEMARELVQRHPDVTKIVHKWGRWQHSVNYAPFRDNKLIWKPGVRESIPLGFDENGLALEHATAEGWIRGIEPPTKLGGRGS